MESLGQRDDAVLATFGHAVQFLADIGSGAVEARVAALTGVFKDGLADSSRVTMYTPMDPAFSGGVVTFNIEGVDSRDDRINSLLRQVLCGDMTAAHHSRNCDRPRQHALREFHQSSSSSSHSLSLLLSTCSHCRSL